MGRRLRRVGKIRAEVEGRIVVEGEILPELNSKLYDSRLREVGVVLSVFGPKDRFFLEVKPLNREKAYAAGEALYILDD